MGTGSQDYVPPEWLTADFLQDVLKEYFKDDTIKIHDMITKSAKTSKCAGFASELHRVTFNLERNNDIGKFSVLVKDHPKGFTGVVAHKSKLFKREILSYQEIIPRIEELLASINDISKISPACYYTTETPEPFLILEDMKVSGFEMFDKGRLMNLEYSLPVLEKIAKVHAASAVIAESSPDIMKFFEEGPISRNPDRKDFLGFFPCNIRCLADEVATWKGYDEITEKLYKLTETVLPEAVEMYEIGSKSGFRVFNSADLWINNLLFRCDEKFDPEDVVLLDYQLAHYGSPAIDLNYFIFGSINENVRKVHYKFMIREYHRHLKDTLEKLNYKGVIPTLKDIHIQLIKHSLVAVIASICLTPIILMENDKYESLEGLVVRTENGDQTRRENIQNPKYKAFIQKTLKEFELSGFLN